MKNHAIGLTMFAALATFLALGTSPLLAKSNRAVAPGPAVGQMQQHAQAMNTRQKSQKKPQTYMGTIIKKHSRYELKVGKYDYKLTGQSRAAKFMGKKVLVTGVYNVHTGTIRVSKIKTAQTQ